MEIYLAEQTAFFLQSLVLGAFLGLLYDIFRITRIAIPTGRWVIFAEDLLFCLICAVLTFLFLMRTIDGQVRFFLFIGEALGAVLYFMSLSILVMRVSAVIINAVKAVLRFVFKWLIFPIWRIIYYIVSLILRPLRFLGHFFKKSAQRCKYRLKVRQKVLYNQLRGVFVRKKTNSKGKLVTNGQKENGT